MDITRWGQLVRIDECALLGVAHAGQPSYTCKTIYTPDDRAMIQFALDQAQANIEQTVLGYPIGYKVVCGEEHPWGKNGIVGPLRWGHVREFGELETTIILSGVALTLGTLPKVTLTVAWTYDLCELMVTHTQARGGAQILPSSVSVSGGVATILIPRCRLVNPAITQPATGFDYNDNANFVATVDIARQNINTALGAELVWFPPRNCEEGCEETTQTACVTVRRRRISSVQVWPATFSGETPTPASFVECSRHPDIVRLSYVANYSESCPPLCDESPISMEFAVVRYAHTLLPRPPCACASHEFSWTEDRKPLESPVKAIDNPFGWLQGQVFAWQTATMYAAGGGGTF